MNSLRSLKPLYYTGTGGAVRSPTVASIKTHTMGSSLSEYLRMKVHPDIQNHRWSRIIVKGEHQRDPSKGREDVVQYTLPSRLECLKPLLGSNLAAMGAVDIVVVGYVHGLERWTKGPWEGNSTDKIFSWKKTISARGNRTAFLGCRVSFWGDIAGNMVRAIQRLNGA
ncbi:MAG: hypothetical protein L6R35_007345, partial [Caloplaca aegaea]